MLLEQEPTIVDETSLLRLSEQCCSELLNHHTQTTLFRQATTSVDELTGCCKLLKQLSTTLVDDKMF